MFILYAIAFFYGAYLVRHGEITAGDILSVLIGLMVGSSALGQAVPVMAAMSVARAAGADIFAVIERQSEIDGLSKEGKNPTDLRGEIEFRQVDFAYKSRMNEPVLTNFNLVIKPNETVAVVGHSGSGKSTLISLIERFYDPTKGEVLLDGINLRELNLQWLRKEVGLVSQMPVLFPTTIYENIVFGRSDKVTLEEVHQAAKQANAHDFIMSFPKGYDTLVGEQGTQLSGGQR